MQFFIGRCHDGKQTFYFSLVFSTVVIATTQYVKSFTIDRNWESQSFTFSPHRRETSGVFTEKSSQSNKETEQCFTQTKTYLPNQILLLSFQVFSAMKMQFF